MACFKCKSSRNSLQPAKSGYGFLRSVLDSIEETPEAQAFLDEILDLRRNTRPGYPPRTMLRAFCLKYLLNEEFNVNMIQRLRDSAKLRQLCGFRGDVPSESSFSRFFNKLADRAELIEQSISSIVDHIHDHLPHMGDVVAIDSTDVAAYANPKRNPVIDSFATWGQRTAKVRTRRKKDKEIYFGYKIHLISDVNYGVPIAYRLRPANITDTKELQPVYDKASSRHPWLQPEYFVADRGYDAMTHHKYLVTRGIKPIIHIRRPTGTKPGRFNALHHGIYNTIGQPTCMGDQDMEYVQTDPNTGHHLYRCPPAGCIRNNQGRLFQQCNSSHWENPDDYLRVISKVARASQEWQQMYAKRTVIERGFSSMKRSRLLDSNIYFEKNKVKAHIALSVLTYAATMLGHVLAGDIGKIRRMRVRA